MTFTHALSTNNYGPAKFVVSSSAANGTHTTIAAALTAASSGDNIFVRDGTYTENISIPAGVSVVAFSGDGVSGNVTIIGSVTMTAAGMGTIANIRLQTNSANSIIVSGTNAVTLRLFGCFLNFTNNTGISFTNSNAASSILVNNCYGDLGTTGIALFDSSATGSLNFQYCNFTNTGGSSTANTISAGSLTAFFGSFKNPITTSGTAAIGLELLDISTAAQNVTAFTHGGSGGGTAVLSRFVSGTASAISVGASGLLNASICDINTTNTNAITGAGAINYFNLAFSNSSQTINTTTQANAGTIKGSTTTAPTAGFLGERFNSFQAGGTPANNTPTTLTSITLTAGNWDISCIAEFSYSGNNTISIIDISTTTNTLTGTLGDSRAQFSQANAAGFIVTLDISAFRVSITTSTTYFLVVQSNFSSGGSTVNGRISAVRVA